MTIEVLRMYIYNNNNQGVPPTSSSNFSSMYLPNFKSPGINVDDRIKYSTQRYSGCFSLG